jgi:hypothetical protein
MLLGAVTPAGALQTPLATQFEVNYGTVTIQLNNTLQPIALPVGAVSAIGVGDVLRTGEDGRAWVRFGESRGEVLLLPNSAYVLHEFVEASDGRWQVNAEILSGEVTHRVSLASFERYQVNGATFALEGQGNATLQVLVSVGRGAEVVIVGAGLAELTAGAERFSLAEHDAWVSINATSTHYQDAPSPIRPAELLAPLLGCTAEIQLLGSNPLNVRTAPNSGSQIIGTLPDAATVWVFRQVASGGWQEIAFASSYGWLESRAVALNDPQGCTPANASDRLAIQPYRVVDTTPSERAMLAPFYGGVRDDPLFYQFSENVGAP